jgi:hypothetical protein
MFFAQHIPKYIATSLDIPRSGHATLQIDGSEEQTWKASYFTSTDGRIRFGDGLAEFTNDQAIDIAELHAITFHKINGNIYINFQNVS